MASKLKDATNVLIEELFMSTGLPEEPFTIVLKIKPKEMTDPKGYTGTSYELINITINQVIWSAGEES